MELTIADALSRGIEAHKSGDVRAADKFYTAILKAHPQHPDANHNMGVLAIGLGKTEQALPFLKAALEANPDIEQFWLSYIDALIKLNRSGKALSVIQEAKERGFNSSSFGELFKQLRPSIDIIERATNLYHHGQFPDALALLTQELNSFPDSEALLSLLGAVYVGMKNHDAAIEQYERIAEINPHSPYAYYNIGVTLQNTGKLDSAIAQYQKAIQLDPKLDAAYNNLGYIFRKKGQPDAAIESFQKAITINPEFAEAHNNLGTAYSEKGEIKLALEHYDKAIRIKPDHIDAYFNMGIALRAVTFNAHDQGYAERIVTLFEFKSIVRPSEIVTPIISLLKHDPLVIRAMEKFAAGELEHSLPTILTDLSNVPLLLSLMRVCPVPDREIEALLCTIRSLVLLNIFGMSVPKEGLPFLTALALQCFANEYIYSRTELESIALRELEYKLATQLANGFQPDSVSIACLASYLPLHSFSWCHTLDVSAEIEELAKAQILDHDRELALREAMPTLHQIHNTTSLKVRAQYEDNPYPRWFCMRLERQAKDIAEIVNYLGLQIAGQSVSAIKQPHILVAGCGTGENSIGAASRFANADILAVDLSLSSLAYAQRKTEELGINNIQYMQADILDLERLDRKFDLIECSGVLHHMHDPMAGWRVLTSLLNPGGLMKIGLYSEFGRQHIVKIREQFSTTGTEFTISGMKAIRAEIMSSDSDIHNKITLTTDFYSLSTVRDLLHHVQEHRFTILQIKSCLDALGLTFCGFELIDTEIMRRFRTLNPAMQDLYSLEKWHEFEIQNPTAFESMYQFWCQKVN